MHNYDDLDDDDDDDDDETLKINQTIIFEGG